MVTKVSDAGEFPSPHDYVEWIATVRGANYAIDRSLDYRELVNDFLRQKQVAIRRQASRRRDGAPELRPPQVPVAGRSIHPPHTRPARRGPLGAAEGLGREHLPGVRVLDSSRELLGFARHTLDERSGDPDPLRGSGEANRSGSHRDLPVRGCRLLGEDARLPGRCAAVSAARSQPGRAVEDEAIAAERRAGGTSDSSASWRVEATPPSESSDSPRSGR